MDPSNGYDAVAEAFVSHRSCSRIGAASVRDWARALPVGATVLDLGCGSGVPVCSVLTEEGATVFGIDASPRMIEAFRERFPHAPARCEPVQESDLFGRRFEGVVAWGLVFLLPPPEQAGLMARVAAALEPGGTFLFTAPSEACEWTDILTGRKSVSLGGKAYRRLGGEVGLTLVAEGDDEGGNHHYCMRKGRGGPGGG